MGLVGLEPTISPLWAARFNQLNYKPNRISTCPSEWTSRVDLCSYSFFLFPSPPSVGFFLCEALPTSYRLAPDARRVYFVFATSVSPWSDLEERSPLISFIQCLQWGATRRRETEEIGIGLNATPGSAAYSEDQAGGSWRIGRGKRASNPRLLAWQTSTLTNWAISPFLNYCKFHSHLPEFFTIKKKWAVQQTECPSPSGHFLAFWRKKEKARLAKGG